MRWIVLAVVAVSLAGAAAFAQGMDHGAPMHGNMPMQGAMPMHMHSMPGAIGSLPTQPGQGAFGAVQEIVGMLEADPTTDWSKVNLDALREHLIDMNEVALHADAPSSESTAASELQSPAPAARLRRSSACCRSMPAR